MSETRVQLEIKRQLAIVSLNRRGKKLYQRAWRPNERQLLTRESFYQWRILLGRNQSIAVRKQRGDGNARYRKRGWW